MSFRYRDNGSQTWSTPRTITVEENSTTELVAVERQLGRYFSRQYEFTFDEATGIALVSVEEDLDYGR
jgi:hypothetical protein